ncbi:MAG: S41 family peptidase [Candidatus Shapirobacteria bacterium]
MLKIKNIAVVLAILAVGYLSGYQSAKTQNTVTAEKTGKLDLNMMWVVKDKLEQMYLDPKKIENKSMVYGAISGLVQSLGDPYTVYLPPADNERSNEDLNGEFGGVGISLGFKDRNLAVVAPMANSPAMRAGLKAGDLILKIIDKENKVDRDTVGIGLEEAVNLIRGKIGTEVTLKMFREGDVEPFEVKLIRDNIVVPSLELKWVGESENVAWIQLNKFSERIFEEWPTMVEQINAKKNLGGMVLDLRNNPGGYLEASVVVASDLLEKGIVVKQADNKGEKVYEVDKSAGRLTKPKLTILVNGGSASASEILAGALKYYKRGKLVGEKTFGKGTVQQPQDFSDGSGLHVTVAKWLLPDGKNIHGVGVDPDVVVKYEKPDVPDVKVQPELSWKDDNQLIRAIEELAK